DRGSTRPTILVALVALGALTAGLLAPHLLAASGEAHKDGSGFVDGHPPLLKWTVFVLLLAAVAAGLLVALRPLVEREPRRSPWLIASFVVIVPLLLGFFDPEVPLFLAEEGAATVAGAVVLWLASLGLRLLVR